MSCLFVSGGVQHPPTWRARAEWSFFAEARLLRLDPRSGECDVCLAYRSPPALCPADEPSFVFKAGSWDGGRLLLCTQTEVLFVDPEAMRITGLFTHPWLNDVHHVASFEERLYVVSTGLDGIVLFDPETDTVELRSAHDEDPWRRLDPGADYRRVSTTKPHRAHPNFVFRTREGVWLTRFQQRDAICLDKPGLRIDLAVGHPHDGVVHDDRIWFTTVNGHVIAADPSSGRVVQDHDLTAFERRDEPLGWCRGLCWEGEIVYVGFSRLRSTRWRENLAWLRRELGALPDFSRRPTRVAAYDLARRRKLAEWDLEPHGLSAVFSVLPAKPPDAER